LEAEAYDAMAALVAATALVAVTAVVAMTALVAMTAVAPRALPLYLPASSGFQLAGQ
jgi:hypothetical protein